MVSLSNALPHLQSFAAQSASTLTANLAPLASQVLASTATLPIALGLLTLGIGFAVHRSSCQEHCRYNYYGLTDRIKCFMGSEDFLRSLIAAGSIGFLVNDLPLQAIAQTASLLTTKVILLSSSAALPVALGLLTIGIGFMMHQSMCRHSCNSRWSSLARRIECFIHSNALTPSILAASIVGGFVSNPALLSSLATDGAATMQAIPALLTASKTSLLSASASILGSSASLPIALGLLTLGIGFALHRRTCHQCEYGYGWNRPTLMDRIQCFTRSGSFLPINFAAALLSSTAYVLESNPLLAAKFATGAIIAIGATLSLALTIFTILTVIDHVNRRKRFALEDADLITRADRTVVDQAANQVAEARAQADRRIAEATTQAERQVAEAREQATEHMRRVEAASNLASTCFQERIAHLQREIAVLKCCLEERNAEEGPFVEEAEAPSFDSLTISYPEEETAEAMGPICPG